MEIIKKVNWTSKSGKNIEVTIETNRSAEDNIAYADGVNVNLGKKTNESIFIEVKADGKLMTRDYGDPQILNPKFNSGYQRLIDKGAYARLGDTYIGEGQYNMVMAAINEAYAEMDSDSEFETVKYQEVTKELAQEATDKKEAEQYAQTVKNGLCQKCGTYCYGDCGAN